MKMTEAILIFQVLMRLHLNHSSVAVVKKNHKIEKKEKKSLAIDKIIYYY